MDISIKRAKKTDILVILSCIKGLAEYVGQSDMVSATEEQLEKTLFNSSNAVGVLIAYKAEVPAGFVVFFQTYSTFKAIPGLYIEDLFVFPQYRQQGIGSALFEYLIQYAKQQGFHKIEWYVNNKNLKAMDFYQKMGARKLDYKSIYYLPL